MLLTVLEDFALDLLPVEDDAGLLGVAGLDNAATHHVLLTEAVQGGS